MNVFKNQWRELITNKKLLISVIGVLFIPLIYSSIFLAAYWDPYGNVDQLPTRGRHMKEKTFISATTLSKN